MTAWWGIIRLSWKTSSFLKYLERLPHPDDRDAYRTFLEKLAVQAQTLTLQYRLQKCDGSMMFVNDTMTSYRQNHRMIGDSVLTDITNLKNENQNLQYLNDTTPFGFLKYTCEQNTKVTYINDRMLSVCAASSAIFMDERFGGQMTGLRKSHIAPCLPWADIRRIPVFF